MKTKIAILIMVGGSLSLGVYGVQQWVSIQRTQGDAESAEQIYSWSSAAKLTANLMIARYGPPQEMSMFRLQWNDVRPWKRIIIQDEPSPLQQIVTYHVPTNKVEAVRRFVHGPMVFPDEGELVATSGSEAINRLSLNLADDIATGRRSPEEADRFFLRTVQLHAAGKSSLYMDQLFFKVPTVPLIPPSVGAMGGYE
jgi:hypothetical protein